MQARNWGKGGQKPPLAAILLPLKFSELLFYYIYYIFAPLPKRVFAPHP